MADRQNQHYVPQFFLRLFSENGRSIRKLRLPDGPLVQRASIKHECSKAYMYGDDGVAEELAGSYETGLAPIIRRIVRTSKVEDQDSLWLRVFMVLQHHRTPGAKLWLEEELSKPLRALMRLDPNLSHPEALNGIRLTASNWGFHGVLRPLLEVPLTLDLGLKLLINETAIPFVLSDNPVCPQNRFMEPLLESFARRNRVHGVRIPLSHRHTGIQMFCPLDPNHAVHLFDRMTYSVGGNSSETVVVRNKLDVVRINDLSFLNSEQNLFIPPEMSEIQVQELIARNKTRLEVRPAYKKAPAENFSFVQITRRPASGALPPAERDRLSGAIYYDMLERRGMRKRIQQGQMTMWQFWTAFVRERAALDRPRYPPLTY